MLHLVDAFLQQPHTGLFIHTLIPPLVHRTQRDVHSRSMRSVIDDCLGTEVIDPIEVRERGCIVVSCQKEVDGIRGS